MKTLLLTRPLQESLELCETLTAKKFRCLVEPLLAIHYSSDNAARLADLLAGKADLIVATSRHAIHALAQLRAERRIPLAVVGIATAELARSLGFQVALSAHNVNALLQAIREKTAPASKLVYARGEYVTADIVPMLEDRFSVENVTLYQARQAHAFSAELCRALDGRGLNGALFFSYRTARAYVQLVQECKRDMAHNTVQAFCMSRTIAAALSSLPWQSLHVARMPDMPHMLTELDKAFENS